LERPVWKFRVNTVPTDAITFTTPADVDTEVVLAVPLIVTTPVSVIVMQLLLAQVAPSKSRNEAVAWAEGKEIAANTATSKAVRSTVVCFIVPPDGRANAMEWPFLNFFYSLSFSIR
jgi:hypothetical protein